MPLDQRENKRRLLMRLKGVESGAPLIGPDTVQIHVTDRCNLSCRYCYYHGPGSTHRPSKQGFLPFDIFVDMIRDCVDLRVDQIYLSGEGEPSLHPRFYEMLEHLRRQSLSVKLFSNATFPIEHCGDIVRNTDCIVINLGAFDRKSYRDLHGKDLFIRVIKNIKEMARIRSQLNPGFHIQIVFLVNSLNEATYSKTEDLVKKLGADSVQKRMAKIFEHSKQIQLPGYEEKTELSGEWPPCYQGWFYSAIQFNGDVNICCSMQRITMGNVFKTSFKKIWESEKYRSARQAVLKGEPFRTYPECVNCYIGDINKMIDDQMKVYQQIQKQHAKD